jgi:hypothetical protein
MILFAYLCMTEIPHFLRVSVEHPCLSLTHVSNLYSVRMPLHLISRQRRQNCAIIGVPFIYYEERKRVIVQSYCFLSHRTFTDLWILFLQNYLHSHININRVIRMEYIDTSILLSMIRRMTCDKHLVGKYVCTSCLL